MHKITM